MAETVEDPETREFDREEYESIVFSSSASGATLGLVASTMLEPFPAALLVMIESPSTPARETSDHLCTELMETAGLR